MKVRAILQEMVREKARGVVDTDTDTDTDTDIREVRNLLF